MIRRILPLLIICGAAAATVADACTSAIVAARASATGRPLLWKHRDTGADNNFLARVGATDTTFAYVGLFNGGDSTLAEAWTGMNEHGFAIMNTASYNLAPDTARLKDREGAVMSRALATCRTVDDFAAMLAAMPKPLGVQANFGVIDSKGGAAYFETDDYTWIRFDVDDVAEGYVIRTNFSVTGTPGEGYGYIRYNTAEKLIAEASRITPRLFVDTLSRSFYHSLARHDYLAEGQDIVADRDFIPRDISTASIVIEGDDGFGGMTMWAVLGYPPCGYVSRVTLDSIPQPLQAVGPGHTSPACSEAMELRRSLVPYEGGSGPNYISLDRLRPIIDRMNAVSDKIFGGGM